MSFDGRGSYFCHGGGYVGAEIVVLLVAAYYVALRIKEDDAGDACYAVEVGGNGLGVDDLRPGELMLLYGLESIGRLVPDGYAEHVKTLGTVFLVYFL